MEYLRFALAHRRFLGFGVTLACFSSFGQTFFIALYGAELRAEFGLTHGGLGLIYSTATLASGFTIIWLGRLVDSVELRRLSVLICLALAAACLAMAAVPTAVLLYGVFFLLRLSGQGMMTHTSVTSVARHYERDRGKAVAIVSLGLPVGEAVLPLTAVALVGVVGWRLSWVAAALLLVLVVVPLVIWLLGGEAARNRTAGATMAAPDERTGRQWSRREVLGDKRFYLILPAVIASSYIITGLFFHQAHLAEAKGWSLAWIATCFVGYAAGTVVAALAAGPMVDRVGAGRLLHLYLLPLAFGLLLLVVGRQPLVALVYMTLAGIGAGAGYTIVNALWAEIYGVTHLGAIRSLVFSFSVLGSGLSPVSMGWLIDAGVSIESIAAGSLGYVLVASVLLGLAIPRRRR